MVEAPAGTPETKTLPGPGAGATGGTVEPGPNGATGMAGLEAPDTEDEPDLEQKDKKKRKVNQPTRLYEQIGEEIKAHNAELFRTDTGDVYLHFYSSDYLVPSTKLDHRLKKYYYDTFSTIPGAQTAKSVMEQLKALASVDTDVLVREARVRFAWTSIDGVTRLYIDLCEEGNRDAIEISATGLRIEENPPVIFIRPGGAKPLPRPRGNKTSRRRALAAFRKLTRMSSDNDWVNLLLFIMGSLAPSNTRWILSLGGPSGTGKTSFMRLIRILLDPSVHSEAVKPDNRETFYVSGQHCYIYCIDNLSGCPTWFTDALCTLSTNSSSHGRALYTNDELHSFRYFRPVILTAISDVIWRPDLASRSLKIHLAPLLEADILPDEAVTEKMEKILPYLVMAFCHAAHVALKNPQPGIIKQRMQSLSDWSTSAAPDLGITVQQISSAIKESQTELQFGTLEASPIPEPLVRLANELILDGAYRQQGEKWYSTAELFEELNRVATRAERRGEHFPKDTRRLGACLSDAAPIVGLLGIGLSQKPKSAARGWVLSFKELANRTDITQLGSKGRIIKESDDDLGDWDGGEDDV